MLLSSLLFLVILIRENARVQFDGDVGDRGVRFGDDWNENELMTNRDYPIGAREVERIAYRRTDDVVEIHVCQLKNV